MEQGDSGSKVIKIKVADWEGRGRGPRRLSEEQTGSW
jgi:hypothetical protein